MKKIEIVLPTIAILGFLIYISDYPPGAEMIICSLLLLSCFYFYFSFLLFNSIPFREIFKKDSYKGISVMRIIGAIGAGFGISITIIGVIFKIFRWTFSNQNLIIGSFFLLVVIMISLIKYFIKRNVFYKEILSRTTIYLIIGLTFWFLSDYTFLELKYRNHPGYIEAVKKLDTDPDNPILKTEEQSEYDKMMQE